MLLWGRKELTGLANPTFAFADPENFEKEGFCVTPLCAEETAAEQVLGLGFQDRLTLQDWGQSPPTLL